MDLERADQCADAAADAAGVALQIVVENADVRIAATDAGQRDGISAAVGDVVSADGYCVIAADDMNAIVRDVYDLVAGDGNVAVVVDGDCIVAADKNIMGNGHVMAVGDQETLVEIMAEAQLVFF